MKLTNLVPILAAFALAFTSLACPTRPANRDAHEDAGSGSGGEGGANGAAGSGSGVAGTSGVAGSGSGGAGASGAAGSGSGVAGASGAAGSGGGIAGASGAAGSSSGVAGASGGVKDGQPCSLAIDCASGVCTPFYVDVDGDRYGTGQAVGFCGASPPIGYAAQSGDCCDSASNLAVARLIHPSADFQTTSAGGVCGVTWDYDCSGAVESSPQTSACVPNAAYPACPSVTVNFTESSCGTPNDEGCNCSVSSGSCMIFCVGHPAGATIGCK